jgi:tetratricopeptide (TPR) repeat protein
MPASALQPTQAAARDRAMAEYAAAQQVNADRPESHANLGLLHAATGRHAEAKAAFEQALALDPQFTPAAVNLADLHRALGQEADAEAVLRSNVAINPDAAALHHALGLLLVRTGRADAALDGWTRRRNWRRRGSLRRSRGCLEGAGHGESHPGAGVGLCNIPMTDTLALATN